MKKLLAFAVATLACTLAHCQDFESHPFAPEVMFVTRAEYSSLPDAHSGLSSFYTVIDGQFAKNFHYSSELHLLCLDDVKALYSNVLSSSDVSFLDWVNIGFKSGKFDFTAGKLSLPTGTFENEEYDFDCYNELASSFWLNENIYQWGAQAAYQSDGCFHAEFTWSTSQFAEYPFAGKRYTYTLSCGDDTEGVYRDRYALVFQETEDKSVRALFGMGTGVTLGNWDIIWDSVTNLNGVDLRKGHFSLPGVNHFTFTYTPSDAVSLMARVGYDDGYDNGWGDVVNGRFYAGIVANWFPVESVRVHANGTYDSLLKSFIYNFGATWTISL